MKIFPIGYIHLRAERRNIRKIDFHQLIDGYSNMFRILVCGDREYTKTSPIYEILDKFRSDHSSIHIIHGGCRGVDTTAGKYAIEHKLECWSLGKRAGPIRNIQMLNEGTPDIVLAFHDNIKNSKGTKNMLITSKKKGVKTILFNSKGVIIPFN